MRTNTYIGKFIEPESVTQVTSFIARINHGEHGIRYMRIDKLSSRLRSMMV